MALSIGWDSQIYHNPVDGKTYVGEGGWRKYLPQAPAAEAFQPKRVILDHIRLLTNAELIETRTSSDDLAHFTKQAQRQVETTFDAYDQPLLLLLQFECRSSGHEVQIATQEDVDQEILHTLYEALTVMPPLKMTHDEVCFQMQFNINPSIGSTKD